MKKILICLVAICVSCSVYGQRLIDYNKTVDFNFGYNSSSGLLPAVNSNVYPVAAMQMSLSVYGIYFDASFNVEGNHSGNTGLGQYYGNKTSSWHLGYSLPVCKWLKIIPVVGMSKWAEGYYDGSDWHLSHSGISNKFVQVGYSYNAVDFGVVFNFTVCKFINIYTNFELHNVGVGIGFSYPLYLLNNK